MCNMSTPEYKKLEAEYHSLKKKYLELEHALYNFNPPEKRWVDSYTAVGELIHEVTMLRQEKKTLYAACLAGYKFILDYFSMLEFENYQDAIKLGLKDAWSSLYSVVKGDK